MSLTRPRRVPPNFRFVVPATLEKPQATDLSPDARDEIFPGWGLPLNYMTKCTTPKPNLPDDFEHMREDERAQIVSQPPETETLWLRNCSEDLERHRFQNAIQDWGGSCITTRELSMMGLMRELMEKPGWERKVFDADITGKWKVDALERFEFTENMWVCCLQELRDKAEIFKKTGVVSPVDFDCKVVCTDIALSQDVAQALCSAVAPLENVHDKEKDWHPYSDEQALDLVHPSLFPLVYGRSRVLLKGNVDLQRCVSRTGTGEVIPAPNEEETLNHDWIYEHMYDAKSLWSSRFQWLPCDIAFVDDDKVCIKSYINNLHPSRTELYRVIETVIAKSVPLWNEVLESTDNVKPTRIDMDAWCDEWERGRDCYRRTEDELEHPDAPEHYKPRPPPDSTQIVDLRAQFAAKGLQVIVKLANIHLTPSSPTYHGGDWHIEGQFNEHIAATSIYYYAQSNIGTSSLAFRQSINTKIEDQPPYVQGHWRHIEHALGYRNEEPAYTELGSVATKEGRLLAFPNVLQHRVPSFELEDKSKPGYRKILALFLVDPYIRILSTAKVPPQQRDWWAQEIMMEKEIKGLGELPPELQQLVFSNVDDFPIGFEEAKEIREEVIEERSMIGDTVVDCVDENSFNFCQH